MDQSNKELSFTEWPVTMEGDQHNRKKKKGNVNIISLTSNVTQYTIIIELYNFKRKTQDLRKIGQKLKALFSLNVTCFTGCKHKSDYTLISKQYPMFDLPPMKRLSSKMHDVSLMALNRGVTTRGRDQTSLQALCRGQKIHLPKPKHVRVGSTFASVNGILAPEALRYCQLDVEAPLILHGLYSGLPNLTTRLSGVELSVGWHVDIMPSLGSSVNPIAQGVVKQLGGSVWQANGVKLRKDQVLVEVSQVYDGKGVIHYPHTKSKRNKCACGRNVHDEIKQECDFYLYSQFQKPSFEVIELKSRLRKYDESIKYPPCIYSSETTESMENVENFGRGNQDGVSQPENTEPLADDEGGAIEVEDVDSDDEGDDDEGFIDISKAVMEAIDGDTGISNDDDDDVHGGTPPSGTPPRPTELRRATDISFNERLEQMILEADKISEDETQERVDEIVDDIEDLPWDEIRKNKNFRSVLGDLFHFMDRAKLPTHHEYKALFFRCLRAAIFVMHKCDVDEVKEVLESKPGTSWEHKMAFDWDYIAQRVRRYVPSPTILYNCMKIVYDFFKDKVDSSTNQPLFHDRNKNKFENVLEMVKKG